MTETESVQIQVGKFAIRPFHEGSVWLENEDGEGMQIWELEFEKLLADYWQRNF